jgi:hypothetical protein
MPQSWSGRRESNPRMQLGKLNVIQTHQYDSCKTAPPDVQLHQRVTTILQNLAGPFRAKSDSSISCAPGARAAEAGDACSTSGLRSEAAQGGAVWQIKRELSDDRQLRLQTRNRPPVEFRPHLLTAIVNKSYRHPLCAIRLVIWMRHELPCGNCANCGNLSVGAKRPPFRWAKEPWDR